MSNYLRISIGLRFTQFNNQEKIYLSSVGEKSWTDMKLFARVN